MSGRAYTGDVGCVAAGCACGYQPQRDDAGWLTGYYIVEYEQHGADCAKYGVMKKARRCLAFLYSVGEDAVEVMTWYDSSAAA